MPALRLRLSAILFFILGTSLGLACLAAPAPPVQDFFADSEFTEAKLSPDARFVAMRMQQPGKRAQLATIDLADMSARVLTSLTDHDVRKFQWISASRLAFDTWKRTTNNDGSGFIAMFPGLYAVNRDGSDYRILMGTEGKTSGIRMATGHRLFRDGYLAMHTGPRDSTSLYLFGMQQNNDRYLGFKPLVMDSLSGDYDDLPAPAGNIQSWLFDRQNLPRLAVTLDANLRTVHYLDPASGAWRTLATFKAYEHDSRAFSPEGFAPDGTLYVSSRKDGDTAALYRYDLASKQLAATPLLEIKGRDFQGGLIADDQQLLGIRYTSDAQGTHWIAPHMQAMQRAVDALLPSTNNLISVAERPETPWVMVKSYSDVQPASYTVFNSATGKLTLLGTTHQQIRPADAATQELVHYSARDGLPVPAWLTLPRHLPHRNLPLVVVVHDGPFEYGSNWQWNAEAQFLASRGYAVLEPQYRGSSGFGRKHQEAGWKQLGLKMQDDISDGTRWLVQQGIADAGRICISGKNMGGHAALMAIIREPGLYRCGITLNAETDLAQYQSSRWGITSGEAPGFMRHAFPLWFGDATRDAAQFAATSPWLRSKEITSPVLLAYVADYRLEKFNRGRSLSKQLPNARLVEWIEYRDENAGLMLEKNRIDFWRRAELFLDRQIGKDSPAAKKE